MTTTQKRFTTVRKAGERMNNCRTCLYEHSGENECPCKCCDHFENFKPKNATVAELLQKTPQEEINHPDRYAGGKYECIDVMQDVFGVEAVKHFCMLNAFKYIWRSEKKNGVEDAKKAVWYLNKYIELAESEGKE